jgi:FkbM family methyltransferase
MKAIEFLKQELEIIYANICENEKKEYLFYQELNENLKRLGIARKILRKVIPVQFKQVILSYLYFKKIQKDDLWKVSFAEKKWAIDFMYYILSKNPDIPYKFYPKQNRSEIKKFIRNKILLSLFDYITKKELFDENDFEKQKKWLDFYKKFKITKRKGYYEFMGFKSKIAHFEPQIFFEKYGIEYIKSKEKLRNSSIIDCGAFIGDSAYVFEQELNPKEIICIEPDLRNYKILLENVKLNNLTNKIKALNLAVSDKETKGNIRLKGLSASYIVEAENGEILITTIDNLVFNLLKISNVGLIKMDIEGHELSALKGAENTIKKFKPVLIISIYHKGQDFFEIPEFLKEIVPEYNFLFVNINFESPSFERMLIAQT